MQVRGVKSSAQVFVFFFTIEVVMAQSFGRALFLPGRFCSW